MKKIHLAIACIITALSLNSQTIVSTSIFSNTAWPASGSPYIVTTNIVVFPGATLTIDPGVVVKFDSGTGLELRGSLEAIGTVADSIVFTSNSINPTYGSWTGITCVATTNPLGVGDQVKMHYVKGLYADKFIDLDQAYHGPYVFKHCYFAKNNKVNHDGGMPTTTFDYCTFKNNLLGLDYCQFNSRVSNSYFLNNTNGLNGIKIVDTCYFDGNTGIALSPYGITRGCTVQNNNIGVSCLFNSVNNHFTGNNVSNNNKGVQIQSYFNGSITFTNNAICNNSIYNIELLTPNDADLSNNCWCTTNQTTIRSTIFDGYVNTSYGLVTFTPILGSCSLVTGNSNPNSTLNRSFINVFPNPFNHELQITIEDNESLEFILYDVASRKILQENVTNFASINTKHLEKGIYIYQFKNKNAIVYTGKLIKE